MPEHFPTWLLQVCSGVNITALCRRQTDRLHTTGTAGSHGKLWVSLSGTLWTNGSINSWSWIDLLLLGTSETAQEGRNVHSGVLRLPAATVEEQSPLTPTLSTVF